MIAFIQPFGVQAPCGGSRILRALLEGEHPPVLSIDTGLIASAPPPAVKEIHLPLRPGFGRLERTRLVSKLGFFDRIALSRFESRLKHVLRQHHVDVIHTIPHTYDIVAINQVAAQLGIPCFLSIHDDLEHMSELHPLRGQMVEALKAAWRNAKGVFAISEEIGQEYSRRYGARDYRIVTDGLTSVAGAPQKRLAGSLRVYYMGLFHLTYEPNLRSMLDALKIVRAKKPDWDISMTCRCGPISFRANQDDVPFEVLPFASEGAVANDMLSADLLYQPMPFQADEANFVRFSMSTKMVTYLGSGLPILFHGPKDAAACKLLAGHQAAVLCTTLDPESIATQLIETSTSRDAIVTNALALARSRFMLADQQGRFWKPLVAAQSNPSNRHPILSK